MQTPCPVERARLRIGHRLAAEGAGDRREDPRLRGGDRSTWTSRTVTTSSSGSERIRSVGGRSAGEDLLPEFVHLRSFRRGIVADPHPDGLPALAGDEGVKDVLSIILYGEVALPGGAAGHHLDGVNAAGVGLCDRHEFLVIRAGHAERLHCGDRDAVAGSEAGARMSVKPDTILRREGVAGTLISVFTHTYRIPVLQVQV